MTADDAERYINLAQTIVLIIIAMTQIYMLALLRNQVSKAADFLNRVLESHAQYSVALERVWENIQQIKIRVGLHASDNGVNDLPDDP